MSRLLAVPVLCVWATSAPAADLSGAWSGAADVGGRALIVRVVVDASTDAARAVIDLPEAALTDFSVPNVKIEAQALELEVPPGWGLATFRDIGVAPERQRIAYRGTMAADGTLRGQIALGAASFPLTLTRGAGDADRGYRREDVRFQNGDVSLAGSLLLPRGEGLHPAIVFTHGSGARTRKAHWLEAETLARRGVAALVYDKRGAGESRGANWEVATLDELATDAEAAVDFLRRRPDIDGARVGLYGLSQGSWIGARVAARNPHVAFVVSVSGSGIPLWQQELYRARAMMRVYEYGEGDIEATQEFIRERLAVGRTGVGWEALEAKTRALRERKVRWLSEFGGAPSSLLSARFWWLAFFSYDPRPDLQRVRVPVLGLFGARDLSVPAAEAATAMREALAANPAARVVTLPGAEHGMLEPVTIEGRPVLQLVAPAYLTELTTWITQATAGGSSCSR